MAAADTYETGYAKSRERFERDTAEHGMEVLRDDGLYRHLRFARSDTSAYYYDLVTWPGRLVVCGDMGDWMFSRTRDMFEFFTDRQSGINPGYWSEKLRGPGDDTARTFSREKFVEVHDEHFARLHLAGFECCVAGRCVRFEDTSEWDLRDFDGSFLWACWAIVRGIAQYRAATLAEVAP